MNLRKITMIKETILTEGGVAATRPITRAIAAAAFVNPFAGRFVDDLSPLFAQGAELGEAVMKDLVALLPHAPVSYGKGAIVGVDGEIEHGAAVIHPQLGKAIREAVGGGQAIICSNVKIGGPGTSLDVPLAHKDNIWSFDHLDTITVCLTDAPRADEIVMVITISDAGRPHPRVGKGRI
jgi:hypothetical protein